MFPSIYKLNSIFFDESYCQNFLFEKNILFDEMICRKCRIKMKLEGENWRCRKSNCRRKVSIYYKSFFSNSKLSPHQVLFVAYLWLAGDSHKQILLKTSHSANTISDYLRMFRDLVSEHVKESTEKIGGPGIIVEIDESKFGKRKYHKGHHVEGVWVFGGVERTPERKIFVMSVPDRKEGTLLNILHQYVEKGSIIYSDCWASYKNINNKLQFDHETVNHSKEFKVPDTNIHTNTIEGTWNGIKMNMAPRNRNINAIDEHLMEFIWRRQHFDDLWNSFLNCLADTAFY